MTRTCGLVVALLLIIVTMAGAQATLHVPATYPTIQAGIDNAVTGDTVQVAPGTYHENLIIQGKEIRLFGSAGPLSTFVDGSQLGTVLRIEPGLGRDLVIEGLTFLNGRGNDGFGHGNAAGAGGVEILCSSPTIKNCRIRNNFGGNAGDRAQGGAGGVALMGNGPDVDGVLLVDCVIRANRGGTTIPMSTPQGPLMNGQGGTGGVLLCESNMSMMTSVVEDNEGGDSWYATLNVGAGGIEFTVPRGPSKIEYSQVCWNVAGDAYDGTPLAGAGGIHGGSPEILYCVVDHNIGGDVAGFSGVASSGAGGIFGVAPKIDGTYVRNNTAGYSGGEGTQGGGGGIYVGGNARIRSSVVTGNVGGDDGLAPGAGGGGGIHALVGNVVVVHCTVANNVGGSGYDRCGCGGVHSDIGTLAVFNSILWEDQGGVGPLPGAKEAGGFGTIAVVHSNVDGGHAGLGNMNVNPLFVNAAAGDYHLTAVSPVLEMGLASLPTFPRADIDGEPRVIGPMPDMGADEANHNHYAGSGEDLVLESLINGLGDPLGSAKYLRFGDQVEIAVLTPLGTFAPSAFQLLCSPFATGFPPTPPPGFPAVRVDPVGFFVLAPGPFPVSDLIAPNGRTWGFDTTFSFPGWSLMVQGFIVDSAAANGWFASTDGLELRFD